MKRLIRPVLSGAARAMSAGRYSALAVGAGSRVDFWKLKPCGDNSLSVGAYSMVATRIVYERPGAAVQIGARTFLGLGLMSVATRVVIGDDVLLSWGVTVVDHNSHSLRARERASDVKLWLAGRKQWHGVKMAAVTIANRAWLGFNVAVLPGVSIGEGAIIGAGSVVTRAIPPWTVAAGNPARVLREQTEDERFHE